MSARIHGGWGLLLLLAPRTGLLLGGAPDPGSTTALVRVLGLRHVVAGLALAAAPSPTTRRWCAAVDATHALTMVGLAVRKPAYRRAAVISLGVSGALSVLECRR